MRPWREQVAAPIGLASMPHQSSVSRFLKVVKEGELRSEWGWLLFDACDGKSLLEHPSTGHRDVQGRRWDVFDFDPAVLAIRQRGLTRVENAPEGERRASEARPGYSGRHRGEVTLSRMLLRHSGSGLWVGVEVHPGNGDIRGAFRRAVRAVATLCERTGIDKARAVMRCDGAHGHVPYFHACQEAGLAFVVRLSHYGLFEREDTQRQLAGAVWRHVTDSTSGPRREAVDLGMVTLRPSKTTRNEDGSPYEEITVRVVASRAHTDNDSGAGVLIDGKLYELFGTTLCAENWPAEDVAALYLGRSDIENGINQAHDLCGLDRVFADHLPGQEFATAVGLMVYNLQTTLGPKIAGLPNEIPKQQRHERASQHQQEAAPVGELATTASPPELSAPVAASDVRLAEDSLGQALDTIGWPRITEQLGRGWQRHDGWPYITCPHGHFLKPRRPGNHASNTNPRLFFQISATVCDSCSLGEKCPVGSTSNRRVSTTISPKQAQRVDDAIVHLRQELDKDCARTATESTSPPDGSVRPPSQPGRQKHKKGFSMLWQPLPSATNPPLFAMQTPLFMAAEARKATREQFIGLEIHVSSHVPKHPAGPTLVAQTPAQKQRRRKTWPERLSYNDLPDGAKANTRVIVADNNAWVAALYGDTGAMEDPIAA